MLPKLGTVNGFVNMVGKVNGVAFLFMGTTLDLTRSAIAVGAKEGDIITSELGKNVLVFNEYETRVPQKLWARQIWD